MNNNIYNIIYSKLVTWLTPSVLRKPKMLAWLGIIIAPVQYVYQDLLRFRTAKLYELSITPQVCYLQKLLNDRYDYVQRRIVIVDAIDAAALYLFARIENKPVGFYLRSEAKPVYLFTRSETNDNLRNDFVVKVPKELSKTYNEMWALIQTYKLASKKQYIQYV